MSATAGARKRIEDAHRFSAIYGNGLASHHPMAIAALDAMGATNLELEAFEAHYLPKLETLPAAVVVIEEGDEAAHLGAGRRAFPEWVAYFSRVIARDGADGVLRRWVDRLTPAVAAGAFHGAIRTAFALESEARDELAHGLAYWASAYVTLPLPAEPSGTRSPHEVLEAIAADPQRAGKSTFAGNSIIGRAIAAARLPAFAGHVASLDPGKLALDEIARAMIRGYAASGSFTLLHGVTGVHAFRVLGSHASDSGAALADLWGAVVAVYVGDGAPAVEGWGLEGDEALDWPAIHARAVEREDEHDIKLAYSCWREWQHRGDELYRRAASARVTRPLRQTAPKAEAG
jgi:hypothetical protein